MKPSQDDKCVKRLTALECSRDKGAEGWPWDPTSSALVLSGGCATLDRDQQSKAAAAITAHFQSLKRRVAVMMDEASGETFIVVTDVELREVIRRMSLEQARRYLGLGRVVRPPA
ncbi:hypothetical protein G3480_25060 [Thiorhodococcus mannitoliphagus]|uniref:Uncharacterized protein n=1 Tax=Thiorhodococcus mannitoliphagus TaxID=329406 RepID=A0A6P1E2D8_9GAMM|nr:hypothetical protein [Thiorhodococcus mannitoliphagus]NEX23511.1 hypothetical protein [Thiorhodococcus mannitoliphagus]